MKTQKALLILGLIFNPLFLHAQTTCENVESMSCSNITVEDIRVLRLNMQCHSLNAAGATIDCKAAPTTVIRAVAQANKPEAKIWEAQGSLGNYQGHTQRKNYWRDAQAPQAGGKLMPVIGGTLQKASARDAGFIAVKSCIFDNPWHNFDASKAKPGKVNCEAVRGAERTDASILTENHPRLEEMFGLANDDLVWSLNNGHTFHSEPVLKNGRATFVRAAHSNPTDDAKWKANCGMIRKLQSKFVLNCQSGNTGDAGHEVEI